jgi:hypothetical protein
MSNQINSSYKFKSQISPAYILPYKNFFFLERLTNSLTSEDKSDATLTEKLK